MWVNSKTLKFNYNCELCVNQTHSCLISVDVVM